MPQRRRLEAARAGAEAVQRDALVEKLVAFAGGGANVFTPEEEEQLVRNGWAFRWDQPAPCIILTESGWAAAGRP